MHVRMGLSVLAMHAGVYYYVIIGYEIYPICSNVLTSICHGKISVVKCVFLQHDDDIVQFKQWLNFWLGYFDWWRFCEIAQLEYMCQSLHASNLQCMNVPELVSRIINTGVSGIEQVKFSNLVVIYTLYLGACV